MDLNSVDISKVNVLLFCAGLGTRLRPLTNDVPKPMVHFAGKRIVDWNLELIAKAGLKKVFVNLHYLPEVLKKYLGDGSRWGVEITYSDEPELLDTGGAIRKLQSEFDGEFILTFNSDIALDPSYDLLELINSHVNSPNNPVSTMLLREDEESESYGELHVNRYGRICKFLNADCGEKDADLQKLMFTGVQIFSRKVFEYMTGEEKIFSITQKTLVEMLNAGEYLSSVLHKGFWSDLGVEERLVDAEIAFNNMFLKDPNRYI